MATKRITDLAVAGTLVGNEVVEVSQLSTTVRISAATISAAATDNSFNDSGAGFVAAGFAVADRVNVTGFTGDVANNIFVGTVTALTTGKMTIGGTDGDVIVDDAAGETVVISKWITRRADLDDIVALAGGGGATALDDLTDVDTTTVAPTDGQALVYDTANSLWKPATVSGGGGATVLDDLTDVDTTTVAPTDGQSLVYDSVTSTWKPETIAGGGGGGGSSTLIGDDVAAGGSNVLTVTGIPATFEHLRIFISGQSDAAGSGSDIAQVTFNADTGANYAYERWNSFGASTSGAANFLDIANIVKVAAGATRFDSVVFDVIDYADTGASRQTLGMMGTTDGSNRIPQVAAGWWLNTANAITSIEVTLASGNWQAGSRLSVVGVGGAGGSGGGTGGGEPSIFDKVLHARGTALDATYGNGDKVDKLIVSGDMRALVYDLYTDSGTAVNATVATVTVPTGKIALLLYYEANDNVKSNPSYYRHRLRNTTAATEIDPTGGAVSDAGWSSPDGANTALHYPVKVGDAGDVLVMQAWSAGDGSYRTISGSCVIAFADATTGAWSLPASGGGGGAGAATERTRVKPVAADFTLQNAGTASITDGTNGVVIDAPAPGSANIRFMRDNTTLPATPYTVIVRSEPICPFFGTAHYSQCIILRNSTTGAIVIAGFYNGGILAQHWSDYTTYSSGLFGPTPVDRMLPWHKVTDDGTSIIFSVSPDGEDWFEYLSTAYGGYLGTPDQVGVGCFVNSEAAMDLIQSFEIV